LIRGGVLQVKVEFEELLGSLKGLVEVWAKERQSEANKLATLEKKLLEVSSSANEKDKSDAEIIVDLTSKL